MDLSTRALKAELKKINKAKVFDEAIEIPYDEMEVVETFCAVVEKLDDIKRLGDVHTSVTETYRALVAKFQKELDKQKREEELRIKKAMGKDRNPFEYITGKDELVDYIMGYEPSVIKKIIAMDSFEILREKVTMLRQKMEKEISTRTKSQSRGLIGKMIDVIDQQGPISLGELFHELCEMFPTREPEAIKTTMRNNMMGSTRPLKIERSRNIKFEIDEKKKFSIESYYFEWPRRSRRKSKDSER